jgi:alpha-methylacyl-CoA racemase
VETLLTLVEHADALVEGFRPGVMERLGVGPDVCLARNPKLVFGRMTGWGQDGPYAQAAGHDINYISLAGALAHFGRAGEPPTPPLNMVGDFGGGGMLLAFGVVCALLEAQRSGAGQVIDAAMVDGSALLMTFFYGLEALGAFDQDHRGANLLDTGAHFYDVYRCKDGEYISLGSIEPQFYAELLRLAGLADDAEFQQQMDKDLWPVLKGRLEVLFLQKSRDEWCQLMEHTDVCFAPVLKMRDATTHPHNVHRGTFIELGGKVQPAPAPRFSRTAPEVTQLPANPGQHTREVLADWGFSADAVEKLISVGAAT